VPWFRGVSLNAVPEPALLGITYPCVLSRSRYRPARGVRANNRREFAAGATRLKKTSGIAGDTRDNANRIWIKCSLKGYLPGREVAVEALLTEGALSILAIFDKPDPLEGPCFEETIYVTPSRFAGFRAAGHRKLFAIRRASLGIDARPGAR